MSPFPDVGTVLGTYRPVCVVLRVVWQETWASGLCFPDDNWVTARGSSSFIHNIYKQIHIHINDKFAQYNTLIVK